MRIPNTLYDWLKWISVIVIPALVVLINTVFKAWGLPYAEPISTTVAAVGLFIGAIIGISTATHNKNKAETVDSSIEWNLSFGGETDETDENEEEDEEE